MTEEKGLKKQIANTSLKAPMTGTLGLRFIERGSVIASLHTVEKLASALGVAPSVLVTRGEAVHQRQHHRQQGAFLATVLAGGRCEDAGRFAGQGAGQPRTGRTVEKIFHRCCHVAKPCRAAERQPDAFFEILRVGIWRAAIRDIGFRGFADGGDARYRPQPCGGAGYGVDAASNEFCQGANGAAVAVIENEDFLHG